MTKQKKTLDLASRRAVQRGVRELKKIGFVSSSVKETYYQPVSYFGNSANPKRIAVAILKDRTTITFVALGPADGVKAAWYPHWADIQKPIESEKIASRGHTILLERILEAPIVWAPRERLKSSYCESVLSFWGYDLPKRRQAQVRKLTTGQ